jgi:hypothetical protein
MSPKLFPTVLMVLDVCAGAVWFGQGNVRKAIYWLCAAILTATVTF